MEPQGSLRTSVLLVIPAGGPFPKQHYASQGHSTHRALSPICSPVPARRLGRSREPDRPEGDGSRACSRSCLPRKGLRRSSPCSAGCGRSVRRLQAASLTRGQRCGQRMETGKERQTHTQRPIQRGLSQPRRSARPSGRAQTRSRTPSSPVTSQQSQLSRAQIGRAHV